MRPVASSLLSCRRSTNERAHRGICTSCTLMIREILTRHSHCQRLASFAILCTLFGRLQRSEKSINSLPSMTIVYSWSIANHNVREVMARRSRRCLFAWEGIRHQRPTRSRAPHAGSPPRNREQPNHGALVIVVDVALGHI